MESPDHYQAVTRSSPSQNEMAPGSPEGEGAIQLNPVSPAAKP